MMSDKKHRKTKNLFCPWWTGSKLSRQWPIYKLQLYAIGYKRRVVMNVWINQSHGINELKDTIFLTYELWIATFLFEFHHPIPLSFLALFANSQPLISPRPRILPVDCQLHPNYHWRFAKGSRQSLTRLFKCAELGQVLMTHFIHHGNKSNNGAIPMV